MTGTVGHGPSVKIIYKNVIPETIPWKKQAAFEPPYSLMISTSYASLLAPRESHSVVQTVPVPSCVNLG